MLRLGGATALRGPHFERPHQVVVEVSHNQLRHGIPPDDSNDITARAGLVARTTSARYFRAAGVSVVSTFLPSRR